MEEVANETVEETTSDGTVNDEQPESQPQGLREIDLEKMNDAELDAIINKEEGVEDGKQATDTEQEDADNSEDAASQEATDEELGDEDSEPSDSEISRIKKQVEDKEAFIQKQAKEIGELRKLLAQAPQDDRLKLTKEEEDRINDLYYESPAKAQAEQAKIMEAKKAALEQALGQEVEERVALTKDYIEKKIPDFTEMVDDIAALAKEDGYPDNAVSEFRNNPYTTDAGTLISYIARVKDARAIKALTKERDELKKKLETLPRKIERASKAKPAITASSGASSRGTEKEQELTEAQLNKLSDEELDKLLPKP